MHSATKLIIDVRNNGGGRLELAVGLLRLLFPSMFPLYARFMYDTGTKPILFANKNRGMFRRGSAALYSPENLLIVTDGRCRGACATFVNKIQEDKLGRIVGVGGGEKVRGDNRPREFAASSQGGDSSLKSMDYIRHMPLISQDNVPKRFLRGKHTSLSFTFMEAFSTDKPDDVQEYLVNSVDFISPNYPPFLFPSKNESDTSFEGKK